MAHQPPGGGETEAATGDAAGGSTGAASFIRHHAGEREPDLSSGQRDLLGRVIARRIERGVKIEMIARAVAHALPELDAERARRLGRDETLRARAWEDLARLRDSGVPAIAISAARDACPACRAAAVSPFPSGGSKSGAGPGERSALPTIPIAGCTHPSGCRCRYVAASEAAPAAHPAEAEGAPNTSIITGDETEDRATRPWYRPRPPRPHGPRWTEEERAARHRSASPPKPARKRPPR